jgi:DUF2075 family protein
MIVYLAEKSQFLEDVDSNRIEQRILAEFYRTNRRSVGSAEINSWRNSLGFMHRIVVDEEIPNNAGVAVEFGIPQTAKRIDFILTGKSADNRPAAIIIELKQWTEAELTAKDAIVKTFLGGASIETEHPSYQAWSYAALMEDFCEPVRDQRMSLKPCAYLHNCEDGSTINNPFYAEHTKKAPAFLSNDAAKLRAFIKEHVKYGDSGKIIYEIRDGKISPSKSLADALASLLQGNREFLMIDDQKLVYETALLLAKEANAVSKNVLIVDGGPGTGKSVVAINLLAELTTRGAVVKYVTKNAAPRAVYENKLTGLFTKSRISNLFTGSGAYTETPTNTFDALVVDEAHRLTAKSGMFQNLGENQIKELIGSAIFSVFFIDEDQRVTLKDIGQKEEIKRWAEACGANVTEMTLESQFRCNGSDGYLAWVDNTLDIRPTANPTLEGVNYEFSVCSSANELRDRILEKNKLRNKARLVAGYCWDWASKKNPNVPDIVIPEENFSATWNLTTDGSLWILMPESVSEVGCIHTCQGLELDYVGVLIGPDFIARNGVVQTDASKRSRMDSSVKGYKTLVRTNPGEAKRRAEEIIKNTYRTLMTRGQKGCFVYSVDAETNEYLRTAAVGAAGRHLATPAQHYTGLPLELLPEHEVGPYRNAVPVFDLQLAAGSFSEEQWAAPSDWVELPEPFVAKEGFFVSRVVGESMNRRIPNGSWCLFKASPFGSREGKTVLVQLRDRQDPENGGRYTVKVYHSTKRMGDDTWEHASITLKPDSNLPGFSDLVFENEPAKELTIRGELVAVLGQKPAEPGNY